MLTLVWFERSLHLAQVMKKLFLTVKTDYVTRGRKDGDLYRQVNEKTIKTVLSVFKICVKTI